MGIGPSSRVAGESVLHRAPGRCPLLAEVPAPRFRSYPPPSFCEAGVWDGYTSNHVAGVDWHSVPSQWLGTGGQSSCGLASDGSSR
eukprot:14088325-Alexandrium_andersonii.AAC.1